MGPGRAGADREAPRFLGRGRRSWREGGAYGYAFEDQARRSTTPASRATAPGSGAAEGQAERDGESFGPTPGLA